MKWFLNVAIIFFIALLAFNIYQLNFNDDLFSKQNSIFTYSGMIAAVGLLFTVLVFQFQRLAKKNVQK